MNWLRPILVTTELFHYRNPSCPVLPVALNPVCRRRLSRKYAVQSTRPPSTDPESRPIHRRGRCKNKIDSGSKNKPTRKHICKVGSIRFHFPRSPVPKFPGSARAKNLHADGGGWPDSNRVENQTGCSGIRVHQRGVASPLFRARGFTCCQPTGRRRPAHVSNRPSRCRA